MFSLLYIIGEYKMITCGRNHIVIQNKKNEIYACGNNRYGQLGLDDKKDRNKFERVEYDFGKIKKIACGHNSTMVQNEKNEIYVCGGNYSGRLGLGDNKNRYKFEKIDFDFGEIKNIACGGCHTIIQNVKNDVYVCGKNSEGQLGLGDNKSRDKFEKVECNFGEIKNIVCGGHHTIIQNEENEVYVCGRNENGQLGLGDYKHRYKFEKIAHNFGEIKKIACGYSNTVIQNEKNEIYVCGDNNFGELGLGDDKDRNEFAKVEFDFGKIKNITCGIYHTVIQNIKNKIYVCGHNEYGQLGLGDDSDRDKFEKVDGDFGEIQNIVCGEYHTIIQNIKNDIYVCGYNKYGQLGFGDNEDRYDFEEVYIENIFEKIYNFELKLNTGKIAL